MNSSHLQPIMDDDLGEDRIYTKEYFDKRPRKKKLNIFNEVCIFFKRIFKWPHINSQTRRWLTTVQERTDIYEINLSGNYGNTMFDIELTDNEYELMKNLSKKSSEAASYPYLPILYVYKK